MKRFKATAVFLTATGCSYFNPFVLCTVEYGWRNATMMTPDEQLEESCQVPYTSCEEYGHNWVLSETNPNYSVCIDCGAEYHEEEEA